MYCREQSRPRNVLWVLTLVLLSSCSSDSTDSNSAETAFSIESRHDSPGDCQPEPCSEHAPGLVATHKFGDVYIYVPRSFLQRPINETRESDRLVFSVCWPDIHRDLANCTPVLERIKLRIWPGAPPGVTPHLTHEERLAEITKAYDGPFTTEDSRISEYRNRRDGVAVVFSFRIGESKEDLLVADCQGRISCRVIVRKHHGLRVLYDFSINNISQWSQIDTEVKALVASFIVEKNQ